MLSPLGDHDIIAWIMANLNFSLRIFGNSEKDPHDIVCACVSGGENL